MGMDFSQHKHVTSQIERLLYNLHEEEQYAPLRNEIDTARYRQKLNELRAIQQQLEDAIKLVKSLRRELFIESRTIHHVLKADSRKMKKRGSQKISPVG